MSKPAKIIQIVLLVAIVVAAIRLATDLMERRQNVKDARVATSEPALPPEAYVVPKKLYPHDLKSAQELKQQPVWVIEGYRYAIFPYDKTSKRANFAHDAGTLEPLERLQITAVTTQPTPGAPGQRQILAVFARSAKEFAVPVGVEKEGDYHIYADEMFYYQDPRQLYDFWSPAIWDAISRHQLTAGMNEFQADFAVGMGIPDPGDTPERKVVHYPNGGHPLVVVYREGRAVDIRPETLPKNAGANP